MTLPVKFQASSSISSQTARLRQDALTKVSVNNPDSQIHFVRKRAVSASPFKELPHQESYHAPRYARGLFAPLALLNDMHHRARRPPYPLARCESALHSENRFHLAFVVFLPSS